MTQHTEQEVKPCEFANGACIHCEATERGDCEGYVCDDSLYANYIKRPWVGLTDEEIEQGNKESWVTEQAWQSAVWWAEAKLKEKNT